MQEQLVVTTQEAQEALEGPVVHTVDHQFLQLLEQLILVEAQVVDLNGKVEIWLEKRAARVSF